jgi:uncharacterized protein (DUF433 family)
MPHEAHNGDLGADGQVLASAFQELCALPRPSPTPSNPFFGGGWPSYPLPQDAPPFWAWLEARLGEEVEERPVEGRGHLVYRRHPWRRQPYLKGRNMTVRQLLGTVRANRWDEEQAARDLDLPVEAVREALRYADENRELLDFEAAYERLILACGGTHRGAAPVPR